jgi:adenylosuccinate synthase
MPLIIVIGSQFGGEGKGLICAAITNHLQAQVVVKCGGPNSTHSASYKGQVVRLRMFPAASICQNETIVFPAGSLINPELLFSEWQEIKYQGRVVIDPHAGIIEQHHWSTQQSDSFYRAHGSTMTGTGAASADRARRRLRLAKDEPKLKSYLAVANEFIDARIKSGQTVLVEGCQAFGLSNYHGEYPYVTSRCTTVGALLAQLGLGPKYVTKIVLVMKLFPTRNEGGKGKLPHELSADIIEQFKAQLLENGGGTYGQIGPPRRVALFNPEIVRKACLANTPDVLAVTGLDKLAALVGYEPFRSHYKSIDSFLFSMSKDLQLAPAIQSWGPRIEDVRFVGFDKI